ncbi:MAG: hypothetical protein AOA66_1354 [Candidatus Bathyarchaeota archaeon BA2]|nr:MAG: hypothetical protein AOA66_1354 [Candidatus Bathyarchaeota archaeon BA2]
MKFVTNGMLGKLTRWLRMLGQDVEYSRSLDDKKLIEMAKTQRRILLTRDLKLYQQAMMHGVNAVLVEASTGPEKLADLARRFNFNLEIDVAVSRCPKCNTKIRFVPKDMVIDKVPKTTSTYYNEFWECPNCGQVYWRGAHWKRIEKTLREAREVLRKQ